VTQQGGKSINYINSIILNVEHVNNQATQLDYNFTNESLSIANGPILMDSSTNDWIDIYSNTDFTLGNQYMQSDDVVRVTILFVIHA
jgi:hypothetical protein